MNTKSTQPRNTSSTETRKRMATIIATVLLITLVAFDIFSTYNYITRTNTFLLFAMVLSYIATASTIFCARLIRNDHVNRGVWGLILTNLLALFFSPFLGTGLGLIYGITAVIVTVVISQALEQKQVWRANLTGLGFGVATFLLDRILPANAANSANANNNFTSVILIILILALIFAAIRQVWNSAFLRLKLTVWTGAIVVAFSIILVGYFIITSRQSAISSAQADAQAVAEAQASVVKNQIAPALITARTLAYNLTTVKEPGNTAPLTREQVNAMLKTVAEENPSFLGTWTLWEPNAFDRQDAQYTNTPLHDATGRFIPYWVRAGDTVEGVAIVDYETPTPGVNDWYYIPRDTKQETLISPYLYPIDGVDVLMTTVSVPIVVNDRFFGVAGVDYRMEFVQELVNRVDLYSGTATAVLFTDDGILAAVRNQPELTLQPATSIYTDFSQLEPKLATGEAFVSLSPDGNNLRVFSPVDIGTSGHWWFSLIIPFSEITAPATAAAVRAGLISFVLLLVAMAALWFFTGQIVRPIQELTNTANAISQGDLTAVAKVQTMDETGVLANTFNLMTSQLRETLSSLEQRIADRTRNLELAAEVGRSVSQVRELSAMLKDASDLILKEFNLYYVQVYLVNPSHTTLTLAAGTGTVGSQLLARQHNLPLNLNSINGRAAIEKQSVVIADTKQSATFRANELLPETRGEMAIPLIVANQVAGVLDMQSREPGILNEEVLPAFEALAGQLAVAIQNANLLAETEQARAQVESQARRLVQAGWREYLNAIHKPEQLGFVFDQHEITPLANVDAPQSPENDNTITAPISITGEDLGALAVEIDDPARRKQSSELIAIVARQVAQQIENLRLLESAERYRAEAERAASLQTIDGWQKYIEGRNTEQLGYFYNSLEVTPHGNDNGKEAAMLALPLKTSNETIGKIAVEGLRDGDEALDLVNAVAERLSAHIENLRLFEETRQGQLELDKRARQLAAVAEISTASSQELNLDKLLGTVVHLTQRQFDLYHAHIFVFNEANQSLDIVACGWEAGSEHAGTHETNSIALDREQSLVARAARTKQAVIINDVRGTEGWLPNPLLPATISEMAVPLVVGDQLLGVLDVQSDRVNAFSEEDANIQTTLASQVATAMQNARSFTQAQKQAEREARLNIINQKIQSATSVEAVLQIAARELGHALGAPMTVAQLSMKDKA